jgi:hypothetical protein
LTARNHAGRCVEEPRGSQKKIALVGFKKIALLDIFKTSCENGVTKSFEIWPFEKHLPRGELGPKSPLFMAIPYPSVCKRHSDFCNKRKLAKMPGMAPP